jgi:phospholipase C
MLTPAMQSIDHIVVLMLENRSFDHMLGFLSHPRYSARRDIDGLNGIEGAGATQVNFLNGQAFYPRLLATTKFPDEPCHEWECVHNQIAARNNGFVGDFAMLPMRSQQDPGQIMGFYDGQQLPTYKFFADEYCVCDRWHCSVPGPTWPNRLFSIAGNCSGDHNNRNFFPPPPYKMPTIFQQLAAHGHSWRYYSHWPAGAFLRTFEGHRLDEWISPIGAFYAACETGTLPDVSWLEPDFGNVPVVDPLSQANDDHPPSDVAHGQLLAANIYEALRSAPNGAWDRTLFILTYDEHGGFYDHIVPPAVLDDRPDFRQCGVRVPTFVLSSRIARQSVSKTIYDHTSLLKTILMRFCQDAGGLIPDMGLRTKNANDLWSLVSAGPARQNCPSPPSIADPGPDIAGPDGRSDMELHFQAMADRYVRDGSPPSVDTGRSAPAPLAFV